MFFYEQGRRNCLFYLLLFTIPKTIKLKVNKGMIVVIITISVNFTIAELVLFHSTSRNIQEMVFL